LTHLDASLPPFLSQDAWVLSDEIYSRLTYDRAEGAVSIYSLPNMKERVVLVDGFSKTYCMTGWRLGWAVMPEALARRTELLAVHSYGRRAGRAAGFGE
jgi:aspartate/methionine/tyrosine aminotransferase